MIKRICLAILVGFGVYGFALPALKSVGAKSEAAVQLGPFQAELTGEEILCLSYQNQKLRIDLAQSATNQLIQLKALRVQGQGLASSTLRMHDGRRLRLAVFEHRGSLVLRVNISERSPILFTLQALSGDKYRLLRANGVQAQALENTYLSYEADLNKAMHEMQNTMQSMPGFNF